MNRAVEVIQTYPNGTTIELGIDRHGNQVHRVCNPGGSMCRFVEPIHVAYVYAEQFENFYSITPESDH